MTDKNEIKKLINAIECNTSRIKLGRQHLKIQDIADKLKNTEGLVSENIKSFLKNDIGNPTH